MGGCFLYHKVTKLKANHNLFLLVFLVLPAVSYITKLLNWKQITTSACSGFILRSCFLYHKVTKLKANHNEELGMYLPYNAVSYITKLLNWKQITTNRSRWFHVMCCFLYHKVTKLKANHNVQQPVLVQLLLFPISQSY